jgi:ABC-type Fe3+-hydroxamate transport system substrate-binding protein
MLLNFKTFWAIIIVMPVFIGQSLFAQAKRIVSLSPTISQNIEILNGSHLIVGCTNYCKIAKTSPEKVVATAVDVNIEKVLLLKPDLVLYSTLTKPQTIETLKSLGIKVHFFDVAKSYEVICNQFIEIGKLIGNEPLAQTIVNKCHYQTDSIKQWAKTLKPMNLFFQIGAQPLFTVIDNTFMSDYIGFLGCRNIASGQNYGTISREKVIAQNPDAIIIVTMGILSTEEAEVWKTYNTLNAVKNNRIVIIDADIACEPTPLNFVATLSQLGKMLYGTKK